MADQGEMDNESGRKKSEDTSKCEPDPESNIHDFVAQEYEKQKKEAGDSSIDEERINNFFARAVSESNRMNEEVDKAHARLSKLHTELGEESFTTWRQEHCAQVLNPHQSDLVEVAAQNTAAEMEKS